MIRIVRGSQVFIDASFVDHTGAPFLPAEAAAWLFFYKDGIQQITTLPMVNVSGLYSTSWNSSVADPGGVYGHVRSTGPDQIAEDFSIELEANLVAITAPSAGDAAGQATASGVGVAA
jgi:hypothetical protein